MPHQAAEQHTHCLTAFNPTAPAAVPRLEPTNLYGPGDNFSLETSHVLPALIRKFHEAKAAGRDEVVVWGTGTPRKLLEVSKLSALGWAPKIGLEEGIAGTYEWFLAHAAERRG